MAELTVEHLEVRYGDLIGVADVSLRVTRGQIVALLGSNGAGKTTTLNAVAGLVRASHGRIIWQGEEISGQAAYAIVSKGLALSPEGWRLFVGQSVEQNLRLGATALRDRARTPGGGTGCKAPSLTSARYSSNDSSPPSSLSSTASRPSSSV